MLGRLAGVGAAALFALGCGYGANSTSGTTSGGTVSNGAYQVALKGIAFLPQTARVSAGQKVTWTNDDPFDHTVTSGPPGQPDGKFDQLLHSGETFTYTFSSPGTYPYFCRIHYAMGMTGTITAQPGGASGGSTSGGSTTGGSTTGGSSSAGSTSGGGSSSGGYP